MNLFKHPILSNDIKREFEKIHSVDPAVRAQAREPFISIETLGAAPLLFKALGQCASFQSVTGSKGKPSIWFVPQDSPDSQIAVVICVSTKGDPVCFATSAMKPPVKTTAPFPSNFLDAIQKQKPDADQAALIHSAISSVASVSQIDMADSVCAASSRYRTAGKGVSKSLLKNPRGVPSFKSDGGCFPQFVFIANWRNLCPSGGCRGSRWPNSEPHCHHYRDPLSNGNC